MLEDLINALYNADSSGLDTLNTRIEEALNASEPATVDFLIHTQPDPNVTDKVDVRLTVQRRIRKPDAIDEIEKVGSVTWDGTNVTAYTS